LDAFSTDQLVMEEMQMADGDALIQGQPGWLGNSSQTPTQIVNGGASGDGTGLYLFGSNDGRGLYVVGRGANQAGVQSYSYASDGVSALALQYGSPVSAGVAGRSLAQNGVGVYGSHPHWIGVWGEGSVGTVGQSSSDFGVGVEGNADGEGGVGVFGAATGSQAIGVYAVAPSPESAALQVNGRAVFSSAGELTLSKGAKNGTQWGLTLSASAFVIATLQQNLPGIYVRAAVTNAAAGSVTVYLNKAPKADARVGWMVVN
jgi:hypothetical protein